ncbi:MAG TPA: hypothetical protein VED84_01915 [Acidimicrobiales bacterium]|nr:hypothetical protein [Acidimicrobiales bacterium]
MPAAAVGDNGNMSLDDDRPHELANAVVATGRTRIYLGAVARAGKTVAMLEEGH